MAWHDEPYRGAPMVDLPGFPRSLYPPDAPAAYPASIDGPDVLAYKRTVSRLGRWPWGNFDDAFSNGFSHGKAGGMVKDSGVAGVQRQARMEPDSGWIGRDTFNLLRSVLVPEGLPNAGQYAMDATAQSLLVDAWDLFQGQEIPPASSSAAARLAEAKRHIGLKESPAGSNKQKFGDWYGMNGQPWCAIFCTYCDQKGGRPSATFVRGARFAYVPYMTADAAAGRNGLSFTDDPKPGDLVAYDWELNNDPDHVGIFERWENRATATFVAIEGNTSVENNSNGGQVMRRTRTGSPAMFLRVREP